MPKKKKPLEGHLWNVADKIPADVKIPNKDGRPGIGVDISPGAQDRAEELTDMAHDNKEAAIPTLVKEMKNANGHVRWGAVKALGLTESKKVLPYLHEALKDDYNKVKEEALMGIIALGDETSVPHILEALKEKRGDVYVLSLAALVKFDKELGMEHLKEALKSDVPFVRGVAVRLLGHEKTDESLREIIKAHTEEKDEGILREIEKVLERIQEGKDA